MKTEIRTGPAGKVELRAAENGPGVLVGYGAVFNRFSQNLGGFVEQVDPAAFNKSLADQVRVMCRYNHLSEYLLGTTDARTLTLEVDGTGLLYTCDLPDTQAGRDVAALAARSDLRFSSFAFRTLEDEWDITPQGFPLRTLKSVQLVDVGPVADPAYLDSTAGIRSLSDRIGQDAAKLEPAEIRALLTTPTEPVEVEDTRTGQADSHPRRDLLGSLIASYQQ